MITTSAVVFVAPTHCRSTVAPQSPTVATSRSYLLISWAIRAMSVDLPVECVPVTAIVRGRSTGRGLVGRGPGRAFGAAFMELLLSSILSSVAGSAAWVRRAGRKSAITTAESHAISWATVRRRGQQRGKATCAGLPPVSRTPGRPARRRAGTAPWAPRRGDVRGSGGRTARRPLPATRPQCRSRPRTTPANPSPCRAGHRT